MKIPHTKKIVSEIQWGEIELTKEPRKDYRGEYVESWVVRYHHPIYSASPFTCRTTFSPEFTAEEVLSDSIVRQWLSRFD